MSEQPDPFGGESATPPVVVVEDEQPAITEPPKKQASGPKWETDARERVRGSQGLAAAC